MNPPQGTAALITESLVVYKGVTDADGNAAKTTLLCSAIGSASAYPNFNGNQIILTSGSYKGQARDINGATNGDAVGTITVANAFDGKIVSGTSFIITGIRTVPAEVAALQADVGDFSAQSNLKSLLAVLGGGWNTANKTMYALLITDLLGHGTHGLAALETLVDDVESLVTTVDGIVDNILLDTQLKFAVAGTHAFTTGLENFLNIDSGTDGAEIISITLKGIVGADWTVELYIPTDDAVASPAAGDKRAEETYVNTDTEGGQLAGIGAIRYNMFLDITNDSAGDDNVDEVIIAYRSRGTVTATWE
jgi:hypothetical protein